jgi:tetratricopeptide (TPR) repeat protein
MRLTPLLGILLPLAACGGSHEPPPPSAAEIEEAQVKEATDLCMKATQGDAALRAPAIEKLRDMTEAYPNNARAFFYLGMCSILDLTEGDNLGAIVDVDPALSRAHELAPDDHRIAGNMWLARFNIAFAFKDQERIDAAVQGLIAASDADIFASFVLGTALPRLEPSTGYPQLAVERLEALVEACSTLEYCRNSPIVLHHDPGLYMQLGDAYARVGDGAKAAGAYSKALTADGYATWAILDEAKAWADGIEERVMLHTDADPKNDPGQFLEGPRTCSGCHG